MNHRRIAIVLAVAALPAAAIFAPARHVLGAQPKQVTATVDPSIDPSAFDMPAGGLPAGYAQIDSAAIDPTAETCTPTTTSAAPDEILYASFGIDWCAGFNALDGLYQSFALAAGSPPPYTGEWAATVYDSAADAQALPQDEASLLPGLGTAAGCSVGNDCTIATFPDTSGSPTWNAEFEVWDEGNEVGEAAVVYPDGTASQAQAGTYLAAMVSAGDGVLRALLGQQQATGSATPTATSTGTPTTTGTVTASVTATPTNTATPQTSGTVTAPNPPQPPPAPTLTATPIPTATPTPTTPPVDFRVYKLANQSSTEPAWSGAQKALTVTTGQKARLAIYIDVNVRAGASSVEYLWAVHDLSNHLVVHHGRSRKLNGGDGTGRYWNAWTHTFSQAGKYRFTGTARIDGVSHHRNLTFKVTG